MASNVLEKIKPSFQKDLSDTPSGNLKILINFMDSHFQSFEKYAKEKVRNEFYVRRLQTLKKLVADDRTNLDMGKKGIQDALSEGGNIYKSCSQLSKFTQDIKSKIKAHEDQLVKLSQSFDLLSISLSGHEKQVISLLEKLRSLN